MAPCSSEHGQTRESTEEHHSVLSMLGSNERANKCGFGGAIIARQRLNFVDRDTAYFGSPSRCPLRNLFFQFVKTFGVLHDVIGIGQFVANENVHHRQHQGNIGAR